MDPRQHLIIVKGDDKTIDIAEIEKLENKKISITFSNDKKYGYAISSVEWFTDPIDIDPKLVRIYIDGLYLNNVFEIKRFSTTGHSEKERLIKILDDY